MVAPHHTLRLVFAASLLASSFWLIGFAWEPAIGTEAPTPILILLASVLTAGGCWLAFRKSGLILAEAIRLSELLSLLISRAVISYLFLVPICGLVVWGLIQAFSPEPSHPDAQLFVWLFALWFPLWLAPAVAAFLSWRFLSCSPSA